MNDAVDEIEHIKKTMKENYPEWIDIEEKYSDLENKPNDGAEREALDYYKKEVDKNRPRNKKTKATKNGSERKSNQEPSKKTK
jgi:hypothetical protein